MNTINYFISNDDKNRKNKVMDYLNQLKNSFSFQMILEERNNIINVHQSYTDFPQEMQEVIRKHFEGEEVDYEQFSLITRISYRDTSLLEVFYHQQMNDKYFPQDNVSLDYHLLGHELIELITQDKSFISIEDYYEIPTHIRGAINFVMCDDDFHVWFYDCGETAYNSPYPSFHICTVNSYYHLYLTNFQDKEEYYYIEDDNENVLYKTDSIKGLFQYFKDVQL